MITEALEWISKSRKTGDLIDSGYGYKILIKGDGEREIISSFPIETIELNTLQGLIDFLTDEEGKEKLVGVTGITKNNSSIIVNSNNRVSVISKNYNELSKREKFVCVCPFHPEKKFSFENYYETEEFRILLATLFQRTDDRETILDLTSKMQAEFVKESTDDNISQEVVIRTSIIKKEVKKLPPFVSLAPFRTFPEINQVESDYLFRVKLNSKNEITCSLFSSGSVEWKVKTCADIKKYLQEKLPDWTIIE